MSDQNIFSSSGSDQNPPSNQTPDPKTSNDTGDTSAQTLALLVGEGRKYKTVEALVKAHVHLDEFAETLKGENAKLREDVAKAKTFDEVLERLKAEPSTDAHDRGDKKAAANGGGLSAQDVAKIVSDTLTGMETQRTRQSNLAKADAAMKQLFGDKATEVFQKEAGTPEMKQALIDLASVSPEKFVAIFAPAKGQSGGQVDSKTSVNTGALENFNASGRVADSGCKEFYDEMRRKNPQSYYSSTIQLQMNKAATANPDKFFNRKSS